MQFWLIWAIAPKKGLPADDLRWYIYVKSVLARGAPLPSGNGLTTVQTLTDMKNEISTSTATMTWWRHQMETFSALLALWEGNPPFNDGFPSQRPVTRSFEFFYLCLNKRLSKQARHRWFETPLRSLWRHCNDPLKVLGMRYLAQLKCIMCFSK